MRRLAALSVLWMRSYQCLLGVELLVARRKRGVSTWLPESLETLETQGREKIGDIEERRCEVVWSCWRLHARLRQRLISVVASVKYGMAHMQGD
jgi:hypothetical protein